MTHFVQKIKEAIDNIGDALGRSDYAKSLKLVQKYTSYGLDRETHNHYVQNGQTPINRYIAELEHVVALNLRDSKGYHRGQAVDAICKQMKLPPA